MMNGRQKFVLSFIILHSSLFLFLSDVFRAEVSE